MARRPTLLHGCSRAATAAEARFRVEYPNSTTRSSRIVALDDGAAAVVRRLAAEPWSGARFFTRLAERLSPGLGALPVDAAVSAPDGSETLLSEELAGADVVVMIATADSGAEAASLIGNACAARGIMTAGLIVAGEPGADAAAAALRPYASVLVVAKSEEFVPEMLTALRA